MLGLLIAAVIFLFALLGADENTPLLASVAVTFPFLWYWHWTMAALKGLITFIVGLAGAALVNETKGKLALFVATPVLLVVFAITSAIFLGSVYLLQQGISTEGLIVNEKYAISGAALYVVGIFAQAVASNNTNSSKKD